MEARLSNFLKEFCELYELMTLLKCSPFFDSYSHLSLDTRNDKLNINYYEMYYPFKTSDFSTSITTSLTFFDFNENKLEHQKMLKLALSRLQKTFSELGLEIFYKKKLISYKSPLYVGDGKERYIFNQYLLDIYRETVGNLFELDFVKSSYLEFDLVERKSKRCLNYGRILFTLQDKFSNSLKEKEIKRRVKLFMGKLRKYDRFSEEKIKKCIASILDPSNYQERRFFMLSFFRKFNFEREEFEKLKRLLEKYKFEIFLQNTQDNASKTLKLTTRELEKLLVK